MASLVSESGGPGARSKKSKRLAAKSAGKSDYPQTRLRTVRIFAYSGTREQSNKRFGTRLKTKSETGERRYGQAKLARFARVGPLRHALPILRKTDCFAVYSQTPASSTESLLELETGKNLTVELEINQVNFAYHLPKPWTDRFAHVNGLATIVYIQDRSLGFNSNKF